MSKKWFGIDKVGRVLIEENLVTMSGFEFTAAAGVNAPDPETALKFAAFRWARARIDAELANLTHNVAGKIARS